MFGSDPTARPTRRHRIAARLRAGSFDRALIAGADIGRSPQLQLRAARLTSRASRLALAGGLEGLLDSDARAPRRTRVRPPHESLRSAAPTLRDLAALLRAPGPLYARGLAMLNELLVDGSGPLYARDGGTALDRALREVRIALGGALPGPAATALNAAGARFVRGRSRGDYAVRAPRTARSRIE